LEGLCRGNTALSDVTEALPGIELEGSQTRHLTKKAVRIRFTPVHYKYEQKNDTEYLHKKSIYRILKKKEIFTRRGNNAGI
jgi:hypothetical protein